MIAFVPSTQMSLSYLINHVAILYETRDISLKTTSSSFLLISDEKASRFPCFSALLFLLSSSHAQRVLTLITTNLHCFHRNLSASCFTALIRFINIPPSTSYPLQTTRFFPPNLQLFNMSAPPTPPLSSLPQNDLVHSSPPEYDQSLASPQQGELEKANSPPIC